MNEIFYCNKCLTWITEEELETRVVSRQTMVDPEELMSFCPHCGDTWENMDSMDLTDKDLCDLLNELKYKM